LQKTQRRENQFRGRWSRPIAREVGGGGVSINVIAFFETPGKKGGAQVPLKLRGLRGVRGTEERVKRSPREAAIQPSLSVANQVNVRVGCQFGGGHNRVLEVSSKRNRDFLGVTKRRKSKGLMRKLRLKQALGAKKSGE